jgi:hypothetical protein
MALLIPIINIHHHAIFQSHKANLKLPQWSIESNQETMDLCYFQLLILFIHFPSLHSFTF